MVGAAESSPPASGRMALCSIPCSLAGLSAELLACSPAPTVAVPGHGCPVWLGAWDSAGAALRIVMAARTIENLFIVNSICTLFMNSLSETSWSNASAAYFVRCDAGGVVNSAVPCNPTEAANSFLGDRPCAATSPRHQRQHCATSSSSSSYRSATAASRSCAAPEGYVIETLEQMMSTLRTAS
jgi:hypothetical protein